MTIATHDAVRLAELHHIVMTMIERGDAFRVPATTTPMYALMEYIGLVERLGVKMFNEHFISSAQATVDKINAKRIAALSAMV